MKTIIHSFEGKTKEIQLPKCFEEKIRTDLIQKVVECEKRWQPYSTYALAGKIYSAIGKLRHQRGRWKTTYGYGISRVPRKIMTRRGSRFFWVGAGVSSTVGGRVAHPPKGQKRLNSRDINKKEFLKALKSAIAATASIDMIKRKYSSLKEKQIKIELPIVIDKSFLDKKAKEFINKLKAILGEAAEVALPKKKQRAGKGKARGRKYKKSAGCIIVTGNNEKIKIKGIESVKVKELKVSHLAKGGPGRLTIFTEEAIKELEKLK